MRVALPGGMVVQAYGLSGFVSTEGHEDPEWGLYLDSRWEQKHLGWPHRVVQWPDFGLPADELDAFDAFREAHCRLQQGELIDLACDGGTGRTGTALACVALLAGVAVDGVVEWVRTNYHSWAVEVPEQEEMIGRFHNWWVAGERG